MNKYYNMVHTEEVENSHNECMQLLQTVSKEVHEIELERGHYVSISALHPDRLFSYYTKECGTRQAIRIGKYINNVLDCGYNSSQLRLVVDSILDRMNPVPDSWQYKVVLGEDIRKYYLEDNYAGDDGVLGASCMRYESCQDWLDIYVDNTRMVVLLDNRGDVRARAILWNDVYFRKWGTTYSFMDRVYAASDRIERAVIDYAISKNWVYKYSQSSYNGCDFMLDGKHFMANISFAVQWDECEAPYLDTMCYYKDGYLHNNVVDYDACLRETDGEYSD